MSDSVALPGAAIFTPFGDQHVRSGKSAQASGKNGVAAEREPFEEVLDAELGAASQAPDDDDEAPASTGDVGGTSAMAIAAYAAAFAAVANDERGAGSGEAESTSVAIDGAGRWSGAAKAKAASGEGVLAKGLADDAQGTASTSVRGDAPKATGIEDGELDLLASAAHDTQSAGHASTTTPVDGAKNASRAGLEGAQLPEGMAAATSGASGASGASAASVASQSPVSDAQATTTPKGEPRAAIDPNASIDTKTTGVVAGAVPASTDGGTTSTSQASLGAMRTPSPEGPSTATSPTAPASPTPMMNGRESDDMSARVDVAPKAATHEVARPSNAANAPKIQDDSSFTADAPDATREASASATSAGFSPETTVATTPAQAANAAATTSVDPRLAVAGAQAPAAVERAAGGAQAATNTIQAAASASVAHANANVQANANRAPRAAGLTPRSEARSATSRSVGNVSTAKIATTMDDHRVSSNDSGESLPANAAPEATALPHADETTLASSTKEDLAASANGANGSSTVGSPSPTDGGLTAHTTAKHANVAAETARAEVTTEHRVRERVREASLEVSDQHALRRGVRAEVDLGEAGRVAVTAKKPHDSLDVRLDADVAKTAHVIAKHASELANELRGQADHTRVTVNGHTTVNGYAANTQSGTGGGRNGSSSSHRDGAGDTTTTSNNNEISVTRPSVGRRVRIVL